MSERTAGGHAPVMVSEVLQGLAVSPGGLYVDCTFGRGGHAQAIHAQIGAEGRLLMLDKDYAALRSDAAQALGSDTRCLFRQGSFGRLAEHLAAVGWDAGVDGILMDLGVSSPQLDEPARGFSFQSDGPLDMRMDQSTGQTAAEWLATIKERELMRVLFEFGEERYARRIAGALVAARTRAPIQTTRQLAELVARAAPQRDKHKHPATRVFQAIRIAVNSELADLSFGLSQALAALKPGGRLVVIAFHSLEDRIVKRFMRDATRTDPAQLRLQGRAQRPSEVEVKSNPRARSAVMRVAEKLP